CFATASYQSRWRLTATASWRSGAVKCHGKTWRSGGLASISRLNETAKVPYLDDLIQRKVGGAEKERLTEVDLCFHRDEYGRLRDTLQQAHDASELPEAPSGAAALHDFLVRIRLGNNRK